MKIFLCETIHEKAYYLLQQNCEIIDDINRIHECSVILSRNLKLDKQMIDRCLSLELIAIHGTGYDDVDIEYAKAKGLHLLNAPKQNALSVSELIVTMMLQLSRQTTQLYNDYRNNLIHEIAPVKYLGHEISYKTFGMIGVGDIALKTAAILRSAFHMRIVGYSRSLTSQKAKELNIEFCESIQDVMKQSDYISLGTSLTKDTYHMISYEELSYMKPTAYLINTSRGAVIDEDALYDTLSQHKIAGAALDVLENEPVSSTHPLLKLDNVIYTPHIGGSTDEALYRVGMKVVGHILDYKIGKKCEDLLF